MPTGTQVFDWTIPREWNIRDAYIKNAAGERVVDFGSSNLHVLNYSVPVRATLPLDELKKHLFTLPEQPDLIPYRTSYYAENWGFCMAHDRLAALPDGLYEVVIDASLEDGSLTYGEYLHRGETEDEFLLSAHICHPSLANDNCSGLALLTHLAKRLAPLRTRYSYRFLFAPGTIGAIAWLAAQRASGRAASGTALSCPASAMAAARPTRRAAGATPSIDRAMAHVLRHAAASPTILDFFPYGYDERQYCSPGFDLPVGLFQRSQFGTFPEYHTSADNLDFIRPEHLAASYRMIAAMIDIVENDWRPRSTIAQGRAAARPARPLCRARRRQGRAGEKHGLAVDPQPRRRPALAARHRRARAAAVRRGRRGGAAAAGSGLLVEDRAAGRPQAPERPRSADEA